MRESRKKRNSKYLEEGRWKKKKGDAHSMCLEKRVPLSAILGAILEGCALVR
jgi:hypothetical protein